MRATISIPERLHKKLMATAKRTDTPASRIIRQSVETWFEKRERARQKK